MNLIASPHSSPETSIRQSEYSMRFFLELDSIESDDNDSHDEKYDESRTSID
jgi:hypothetical protein